MISARVRSKLGQTGGQRGFATEVQLNGGDDAAEALVTGLALGEPLS